MRIGGLATIATAIVLGTALLMGQGGGPGLANLWVDTNGGTCVDNVSPVAYSDATACTWDAANDTCEAGDSVGVKGGSYGAVTLTGSNSRAGYCTFTVTGSEQAVLTSLTSGAVPTDNGADWIAIIGPTDCRKETATCQFVTNHYTSDRTANVLIDGWDVDGNGTENQQFHICDWDINCGSNQGAVTIRNSRIHNSSDQANAMSILIGDGPWVIEDTDFYDALYVNTGSDQHTECAWTIMKNVTLRRTRWWNCAQETIFMTAYDAGGFLQTNWLVENNWFQNAAKMPADWAKAFVLRNGGDGITPNPDGFIFRYNIVAGGIQINDTDNQPTTTSYLGCTGLCVYGNYFLLDPPCGLSNTSYDRNITVTGNTNCGTNQLNNSLANLNAGFVTPVAPPGESQPDYHLDVASGPLCNLGNTASYPTDDIDAAARYSGSAPELGADEWSGC
jgi:hypothetical protein